MECTGFLLRLHFVTRYCNYLRKIKANTACSPKQPCIWYYSTSNASTRIYHQESRAGVANLFLIIDVCVNLLVQVYATVIVAK